LLSDDSAFNDSQTLSSEEHHVDNIGSDCPALSQSDNERLDAADAAADVV